MKFPKKEFLTILIWIISFILFLVFTPIIISFFKPLIISIILSLIIYPMVKFLEKKCKIIKPFGVTIVSIFILLIIIFCGYFLFGFLYDELLSLLKDIPSIYSNIQIAFDKFIVYLKKFNYIPFMEEFINILNNLEIQVPSSNTIIEYVGGATSSIFRVAKNLPDFIINFIFICLFSILFILNANDIKDKIQNLFNKVSKKNDMYLIIEKLKNIFWGYISAQLKLLLITFIIVIIGFKILDIKYVFLMALVTSLLDMLPFFGTGTILGPYAIISFFYGDYKIGIGCIIIYFITFIIRRIIEPKLIGESVGVSSLFSVFCMFLGYQLIGLLGLILGIPIGVVILYLYKMGIFEPFIKSINTIMNYIKISLVGKEVSNPNSLDTLKKENTNKEK